VGHSSFWKKNIYTQEVLNRHVNKEREKDKDKQKDRVKQTHGKMERQRDSWNERPTDK
jgi:hypothetical protein